MWLNRAISFSLSKVIYCTETVYDTGGTEFLHNTFFHRFLQQCTHLWRPWHNEIDQITNLFYSTVFYLSMQLYGFCGTEHVNYGQFIDALCWHLMFVRTVIAEMKSLIIPKFSAYWYIRKGADPLSN